MRAVPSTGHMSGCFGAGGTVAARAAGDPVSALLPGCAAERFLKARRDPAGMRGRKREPLGSWCESSLRAERCPGLNSPWIHPSVRPSRDCNGAGRRLSTAVWLVCCFGCVCVCACCCSDDHEKFYIITFKQTPLVFLLLYF